MQEFTKLKSKIYPLPNNNVDTDQIIPARYLKVTDKSGLAEGLFYAWRYLDDGSPDPKFSLNRPEFQGANIIVAGDNFGCGSSREHAPWALTAWGIRAIISSSIADIFRNNAIKNGLLPVIIDPDTLNQIFSMVEEDPSIELAIDLEAQMLMLPDGRKVEFPIDPFSKSCLLEGIDQLGYLLKHEDQITGFEGAR